ncbi:protoporphyrinogen oxidase [Pontibacter liquoris]|uniref:protoporphyrinogen oxidase n=1 Tax=Pontibacter liquoris TaxID=2905677 RepID=UPI001FA6C060|nr:protoporphyrinogen oxidase [Pontibacter liquoris]
MRVAIIGAGISGLSLAYYLQKFGVAYDLLEASAQVGGNIRTERVNDYLLELGPNTLQTSPELSELVCELKLEQEVQPTAPQSSDRFVLRNGTVQQLPASPLAFLTQDFFSWHTKQRILQEKDIPPADVRDETLAQFFERRFGRDVVDYAVDPLVTGIFAGDPNKILLDKVLPSLKLLETKYGSVLKGLAKHPAVAKRKETFSFKGGMGTLPEAIADKLISLHLEHRVEVIARSQGKYVLSCASSGDNDTEEYDLLVLALPAHQAADLLQFTFPGIAAALHNINYPPMAVVHTAYNRREVEHPLCGFGALHPQAEAPFAAGSIWTSSLFPDRCRPHEVLFTTFVGGTKYASHAHMPPEQLLSKVHRELCSTYAIHSEAPAFQHLHVWEHALPQYDLYIEDAHQMARQMEQEALYIAANWQAGVSVLACIRHAKELARKINLKRANAHNS